MEEKRKADFEVRLTAIKCDSPSKVANAARLFEVEILVAVQLAAAAVV